MRHDVAGDEVQRMEERRAGDAVAAGRAGDAGVVIEDQQAVAGRLGHRAVRAADRSPVLTRRGKELADDSVPLRGAVEPAGDGARAGKRRRWR